MGLPLTVGSVFSGCSRRSVQANGPEEKGIKPPDRSRKNDPISLA